MRVTATWLKQHAASTMGHRHAWTWAQLKVLGVPLPPSKGWMQNVVDGEISDARAAAFVQARTQYSARQRERQKRAFVEMAAESGWTEPKPSLPDTSGQFQHGDRSRQDGRAQQHKAASRPA